MPLPRCAGSVTKFHRYRSRFGTSKVRMISPIVAVSVATQPNATSSPSIDATYARCSSHILWPMKCSVRFCRAAMTSALVMAALQNRTEHFIGQRMWDEHRAYVASIDGEDVAFGWVATDTATIGEIMRTFDVPKRERYLWNFVTLPAHRGKGIYPRLLDAIVRAESSEADRFWVAYAPENHASGMGIHRAGFRTVAQISFDHHGRPAVRMLTEGAPDPSRMLGLP